MQLPVDDLYALLGVPPTATTDQIHAAYRDRCFLVHPDRLAGAPAGARRHAEVEMRRLNRAWEILGDPAPRAAYDAARDVTTAPAQPATPAARQPVTAPLASERIGRRTVTRRLRRSASALVVMLLLAIALRAGSHRTSSARDAAGEPASPPAAPELAVPVRPALLAGDFEGATPGWQFELGADRVTRGGRRAPAALQLAGDGGWRTAHSRAATAGVGCHELEVWVRGAGSGRLDVLTDNWERLGGITLTAEPVWTRHAFTFAVTDAAGVIIAARDSTAGPPLTLDDLSLTPCQRDLPGAPALDTATPPPVE